MTLMSLKNYLCDVKCSAEISELLMSKYANEETAFNGTFNIFIGVLLLFVILSLRSKTNKSFAILSLFVFAFMHVVFYMDIVVIDTYFHGDGQAILGFITSIPKSTFIAKKIPPQAPIINGAQL